VWKEITWQSVVEVTSSVVVVERVVVGLLAIGVLLEGPVVLDVDTVR
jgi:hypothetical protein